jgi:hypothetical protein
MTFTITPPEVLKLPTPKKGALPYYDDTRPFGERCLFRVEFICAHPADDNRTLHVKPEHWKIAGDWPDAYLLAQIEDIACGQSGPFAKEAILLHFGYDEITEDKSLVGGAFDNWRYQANRLLEKAFSAVIQRVSLYNPPPSNLIKHTAKARK